MAFARPFAYNPGTPIPGTEQVGSLSIGSPTSGFTSNPQYWNGPDEQLGYIIAQSVSGNTQPTPLFGITASVGFFRTEDFTDGSFITLSETISQQSFATAADAKTWLNDNGYWTSYGLTTPLTITLEGFYFEGSVGAGYLATANQVLNDDVSISFTNVLGTITGPPLLISGSVVILSGQTSGYTQTFTDYDYNDLTQVSSFTGITFNVTGSTEYGFTSEISGSTFDVTPTPTPTGTSGAETPTPTPTNTETPTPTPTESPTPTPTPTLQDTLIDPIITENGEYIEVGNDEYLMFVDPVGPSPTPTETEVLTPTPTETPTPTPTGTETPTPTPTPTPTGTETPTPTNTETPTNTPTPSTTPIPVTGYSFNLIVLPYNFPATGNTIMNQGAVQTGTTNPNELTISGRGIYFNSIDSDGIDRTNYFSQFTGQSVTITMTQTGSTAIYSGDSQSLKYWTTTGDTGFVFGTQVGIPPSNTPSGNAVLIQSATTNWTDGLPVYISVVNNNPSVTPTPTATSVTPTPTPTSGASGNFNVLVSQVGPDVVWSGSGSFNLTSLTLNQNIPGVTGGFNQPFAQFIIGPTSPSGATTYSGSSFTTFPTSFGSGGGLAPSSSSGSLFGVVQTAGPSGPREVVVPPGYVSGTVISGSMTYNTQTIAGMGLSGGTYTWAWGSGGTASTLVMTIENVGVTPTPTPTSTSTPTNTPTPSPTTLPTIYTNGTVLGTCSDYCTTNYNITTVTSADNSYVSLTIGDFIYGISGAGFIAYSNVSTNTTTGPFQIAEINSSGEILGIYICNGSSCDPI